MIRPFSICSVTLIFCGLLGCSRSTPVRTAVETEPPTDKMLQRLSAERTGIDFQSVWDKPAEFDRIFYSQNTGGGVTVGDYDADGLPDLYFSRTSGGNRLYRNVGDFRFEDVTVQAGLADDQYWSTGASFVDIDNDGDLDLYVCGYDETNKLYRNNGDGTFFNVAGAFGLDFHGASVMMSFADYDLDGDLDAYLVTAGLPPGPEHQFRVRFVEGRPEVLPELREYWQMLYLPGERARQVEAGQFDHLFRNEGPGQNGNPRFVDVSQDAGIDGADIGQASTWWDYNQDGYPDLYVANDYWGSDKLYRNNADGTFTDIAKQALPHTPWSSMGTDAADINGDGKLDLIATDMAGSNHFRQKVGMGDMNSSGWFLEYAEPRQYMRNALYVNSGTDRFFEAAFLTGVNASDWTWSPRFEDLDLDGRLDLIITNGMSREFTNSDLNAQATAQFKEGTPEFFAFWMKQDYKRDQNLAFRNLGDFQFQDVSQDWGFDLVGVSHGAATADLDGDGDLDVVVNNMDTSAAIYRNNLTDPNFLRIKLAGSQSNRFGLGATVRIEHDGQTQIRYLTLARGWNSTSELVATFGLGDAKQVDRIVIDWPSGIRQELQDVKVRQEMTVKEGGSAVDATESLASHDAIFRQVDPFRRKNAVHVETPYDDYAKQPLLPSKMSQLGPGVATADIDGNGFTDLYLSGAAGQAGELWMGTEEGFEFRHVQAFAADAQCEDMGAIFLDVDGDDDLDLYVVSGGVECSPGDTVLKDRLYLNQDGRFELADAGSLPDLAESGGVVAAADYDRDGDLDLFVGGRVRPHEYPLPSQSYLLQNENGCFALAEMRVLNNIGMVTAAVWTDLNDDGWLDLAIAHEWGPIRILLNTNGSFVDATAEANLADMLGWWNSISAADVDADGDIDLVVGNYGLNTKYHASKDHPVQIHYGDFDATGNMQIVESEYEGDKLYPVRGKSCSTNAMPFLAQKFETYTQFGLAELDEIYSPECLNASVHLKAYELRSGVLINESGKFEFKPWPRLAQIAPVFGTVVADWNRDGHLDIFAAQNSYSPQRETGHMDGGMGLLLLGNGAGDFQPMAPEQSGILIPGDAKSAVRLDYDRDQDQDLLVGVNNGRWMVLKNERSPEPKAKLLRLEGPVGNRQAIGARVTVSRTNGTQVWEVHSAEGYLSAGVSIFELPRDTVGIDVRWADGSHQVREDLKGDVLEMKHSSP